jgi:hypothetical protein
MKALNEKFRFALLDIKKPLQSTKKKTFIDVNRKSENIISFKKYSDGKFRRESVR